MKATIIRLLFLGMVAALSQNALLAQVIKDEEQLKIKVAQAVRMLAAEGLIASSGHVSARIPGTNRILINSNYTSREFVEPKNLVTVSLDDQKVGGEEPFPDEVYIHTAI